MKKQNFDYRIVLGLLVLASGGCSGEYHLGMEMKFKALPDGVTPVPCGGIVETGTGNLVGTVLCDQEAEMTPDEDGYYRPVLMTERIEELVSDELVEQGGVSVQPYALVDGKLFDAYSATFETREEMRVSVSQFVITPEYESAAEYDLD